jgi:predicted homoserine dehydrogenase-like protein
VEGCRLRRAIARDAVITFDDVDLPGGRLADRLYAEQMERFATNPERNLEPNPEPRTAN